MSEVTLFSGTRGLNTKDNPVRITDGIKSNPAGLVDLAEAVNVYVDDAGMPWRRKGYSKVSNGKFHSLFSGEVGGECFVVQDRTTDAAILKVSPVSGTEVSLSGVRSGLSLGRRVDWIMVNDEIYYTNGYENGFLKAGASFDWPVGSYIGPETDTQFYPAPIGDHLGYQQGGLLFISKGTSLFVNHKPFEFGLYALGKGVVNFSSKILMVCPVKSGVFVSDSEAIWFLRGTSWFDFTQEKVAEYPASEWSLSPIPIELSDMGLEGSGKARVWLSHKGFCVGLEDGTMINLTKDRVILGKKYSYGASVVCSSHQACKNQIIGTFMA